MWPLSHLAMITWFRGAGINPHNTTGHQTFSKGVKQLQVKQIQYNPQSNAKTGSSALSIASDAGSQYSPACAALCPPAQCASGSPQPLQLRWRPLQVSVLSYLLRERRISERMRKQALLLSAA